MTETMILKQNRNKNKIQEEDVIKIIIKDPEENDYEAFHKLKLDSVYLFS